MSTNNRFEKKLFASFVATTIASLLLAAITWKVLRDADDAAQWVAHTSEVLDSLASAQEATFQIESMTRGYMIYGDKNQLANRDAVAARREAAIKQLERLTTDNPNQQARLPLLRKAVSERRALSDQIIATRETQGFEAARSFSANTPLVQTQGGHLAILVEMDDEEHRLLKVRSTDQQQARKFSVILGWLTALAMLGLLTVAYVLIKRQMQTTRITQSALEATNQTLKIAKDEADHANAAKDTFMATMSHEIRTPMSGLLGMLELLSLSKLDREQVETLGIARDSGHALGRIIDDILDHAKIKAGKLHIAPEPVSLAQLLVRNVNTYFAVASSKGLVLRHKLDPSISPALLADPLRLLQILGNLVSNAIKFTDDGHVEVRADFLSRTAETETIRLSVQDTGIGMTPEVLARIFKPFEQAGMDTARLYGGTGLGLAISRRLAQMMGSDIVIASTPQTGTTMSLTLTLPLTDVMPVAREVQTANINSLWHAAGLSFQQDTPAPAHHGSWVLAVDDSPVNRLLITRQLNLLGMRVQTAADGQEALSLWRSGEFALVITDCNMPVMDGYALSQAIREIEATQSSPRVPVLAWTANALPDSVSKCQASGMDDVLTKPANLGQLRTLLARLLPAGAAASAMPMLPIAPATNAVSTATSQVIDLRYLQDLAGGDKNMLQELIQAFHKEMQIQIPLLTTALQGHDLLVISQVSHKLRGSAGNLGAHALAAVCARIEEATMQAGDLSSLGQLQPMFIAEAQRVLDELLAF
jgi:signal transduction histidine kinase/CheY-like chemotaxis protein/HPt (histidine-containing phosphotransfer) domain-containing protein